MNCSLQGLNSRPGDMNERIKKKLISYYTRYYRDDLSFTDYSKWATRRLDEEVKGKHRLARLKEVLGGDFQDQDNFFVGAGTGELSMFLNRKFETKIYGIEPNENALDITHERCREQGVNEDNFKLAYAEQIPFPDDRFDLVHCFWVLEHVADVAKTIDEMIRIAKPGGKIYVNTPNYSYPYDGHYKVTLPTFLPKTFSYLYLRLIGRSPKFLRTINFITERDINRILVRKQNIMWQRVYEPLGLNRGRWSWLLNYLRFRRFVFPNQEIIITKLA